jgi:ribosomal protein L12E/L44/L45/RPP1/RPP2
MTDPDLWEMRTLPGALALEFRGEDKPALVLVQGDNRVRVELARVKALVAALTDAAADLAELLASGGVYHA